MSENLSHHSLTVSISNGKRSPPSSYDLQVISEVILKQICNPWNPIDLVSRCCQILQGC